MATEEEAVDVVLSQFLLHMNQQGISLCYLFLGDDPQPLTTDEVQTLKDGFLKK